MRKFLASVVFTAVLTMGHSALAVPIDGTIQFGGDGNSVGSATWFGATGVTFINPWAVTARSGDYSPIPMFFNPVTFTDISWGAGGGPVALSQTVWTLMSGGLTYTLTVGTVDSIMRGDATNDNISVIGSGTLMITGFDDTPGTWSFTAGNTAGGVPNLSFSSGTQQVPAPSTLSLLGLGLAGFGLIRHLRKVG